MISLIIPTLGKPHLKDCVASLRHLPFPVRPLFITEGAGWAEAINIGLAQADGDVLIMDDDVILQPGTFENFVEYQSYADIIGFKLLFPDGRVQHAGGFVKPGFISHILYDNIPPMYVCHCTASLLYIKRHVLEVLKEMVPTQGVQFEDVDFSFRALKEGFKIMVSPGTAIHVESATKKDDPCFAAKMGVAWEEIKNRHMNDEFTSFLMSFPREVTGAV